MGDGSVAPKVDESAPPGVDDATLQPILDTALDAVVVMRGDGMIVGWNPLAEETFGWPRAAVIGKEMAAVIIPERFRDAHRRGLAHYLASGEGPLLRKRLEISALRNDGSEFPVELSISPFETDSEQVFLGFVRDITDRQKAAEVLQNQAQRATLLHEATSLAAESASFEDVLKYCLEAVCQIVGWPAGHAYLPAEGRPVVLVPSGIWHIQRGDFTALREITAATRFSPGQGLPGKIWQTRQPIWITDVDTSPQFPRARMGRDIGVKSAYGFPIRSGKDILAILEFFTDTRSEPDANLLLTARALGDQVGRVLERKRETDRQELLRAELDHRVKNMLTVVLAMATQTSRSATSVEQFRTDFVGRVTSLSRTYGALTERHWRQMTLDEVISEVTSVYVGKATGQIDVSGPSVSLEPRIALIFSMIVHELVTNAVKYGALTTPDGRVEIAWSFYRGKTGDMIELRWSESGLHGLAAPDRAGFGSKLIETSIKHDLAGEVQTTYAADGVRHVFRFPRSGLGG